MSKITYSKPLESLRAFAVLSVMVMHAGLPFGGGYGVQIFFVLSGFLITKLLILEFSETGRISVKDFFRRRALRLLPALWFMFLVVSLYAITIAPEPFGRATLWGVFYGFFYISNWAQAFPAFFPWGWLGLIGQTWSLAVEVQFYLIWPFILLCLLPLKNRRAIAIMLVFIAAIMAIYSALIFNFGAPLSYINNATDTNIDGLLLGSALAFYLSAAGNRHTLPSWAAIAAVFIAYLIEIQIINLGLFTDPVKGGRLLVEILAAISIWSLMSPSSFATSLIFEFPLIVYIGRISYGLYLWHFPIYVSMEASHLFDNNKPIDLFLKLALPFIFAGFSYRFLERPILARWSLINKKKSQ